MTSKLPNLPRTKTKYEKPEAGEWVQPIRRGYRLACCDCGLVHTMNFRVKDGRVQFAVFRNNRASAAIRRSKHSYIPNEIYDAVAAALLKAKGKKSLKVGKYRIKYAKKA